jgi:hypothetical protein
VPVAHHNTNPSVVGGEWLHYVHDGGVLQEHVRVKKSRFPCERFACARYRSFPKGLDISQRGFVAARTGGDDELALVAVSLQHLRPL